MNCHVCGDSATFSVSTRKLLRVRILAGGIVRKRFRMVLLRWREPCLNCLPGQVLLGNWKAEWL